MAHEIVYCDNKFGVVSDQRIFYYSRRGFRLPGVSRDLTQHELPLDQVISARLDRQLLSGIDMAVVLLLVLICFGGGYFFLQMQQIETVALIAVLFCFQLAGLALIRGAVTITLTIAGYQQPVSLFGFRWDFSQAETFVDSISNQKRSLQSSNSVVVRLLQAAKQADGRLTVSQAVLETGLPFEEIEHQLQEMVQKGYVEAENDPATGTIRYWFFEL